jgi:hypothetical protein
MGMSGVVHVYMPTTLVAGPLHFDGRTTEWLSPAVSAATSQRDAVTSDAADLGDLITCGEGGSPLHGGE